MSNRYWWPPPPHVAPTEDNVDRLIELTTLHGRPIAVTAEGCYLITRDRPTGRVLRGPLHGHTSSITSLAVGRVDGTLTIASGDERGCVRLWNLDTGIPIGILPQEEANDTSRAERVLALTFLPLDGVPVVVSVQAGGRNVRIWDVQTRTPINQGPDTSDDLVYLAAFGRYGRNRQRVLATAGAKQGVRIWNPTTGALLSSPVQSACQVEALAFDRLLSTHVLLVAYHFSTRGPQRFVLCIGPKRADDVVSPLPCGDRPVHALTCGSFERKRVIVTCGSNSLNFWHRDGSQATSLSFNSKIQDIAWALPSTIVAATSRGFVSHEVWPSFRSVPDRGVGVCLSGGGHRAALFGLGALLYMVDAGLNTRVRSIASVSGGSLLNAFVAQECDFGDKNCKDKFERAARQFVELLVTGSTFSTKLLVCLALLTVVPAGAFIYGYPPQTAAPFRVIGALVLLGLFLLRGHVLEFLVSRRFFGSFLTPTKLGKETRTIEHAFCTTDLAANEPFYFSSWNSGHAYTSTRGWSRASHLSLGAVVRASAAFPGAIPPRRFRLVGTGLRRSRFDFNRQCERKTAFLSDGGVWNNLATDWMDSRFWRQRLAGQARLGGPARMQNNAGASPGQLIVVNSSYPQPATRGWLWSIPFVAEFAVLLRVALILLQNTIQPRIDALRARTRSGWLFDTSKPGIDERAYRREEGTGGRAAVVSIHESFGVLGMAERHRVDPSGAPWVPSVDGYLWERIREAADFPKVLKFADGWTIEAQEIPSKSQEVPTTFGRMNRRIAALLIWHGYVATRNECHVVFGSRLHAPDANRIGKSVGLCAGKNCVD